MRLISSKSYSLNPFEVREVLQAWGVDTHKKYVSLNPFEVREVLQEIRFYNWFNIKVSIPLKSGRCCKKNSV